MSKNLYVLVGAPGAGKSTWVKNHFTILPGYTVVVSRDQIRFRMVKEDEEYFSKENQVFKKYVEDIVDGLEHADNVICDATHLNEASRNKLLRAIGPALRNVKVNAVVINTPLEKALAQNENRIGTRSYVPVSAIRRMHCQLTKPSLEEGFDKIYVYNTDNEIKYTVTERREKLL